MPRYTVKTIRFGTRKTQAAQQAVARAARLLRARSTGTPRAPLRTGGFWGPYYRRGRTELKTKDVTAGNTTIPVIGTGSIILLNGIQQGVEYTERIGRKVTLKSILFRMTLYPLVSLNDSNGNVVRVMLIYDCQTNAATPLESAILQSDTSIVSPMNLDNRDRFKVIKDWIVPTESFTMSANELATGSPKNKVLKVYKKLNYDVIFGGTGATSASIQTGAVWLLLMGMDANASWTCDYYSRIRFSDA